MKDAAVVYCLLLTVAGASFGSVIYVPSDQATIQAGIDSAVDGDTVVVLPGTYLEGVDFKGKAIVVESDEGPESTVIDGEGLRTCVSFAGDEGRSSVVDGFTLRNGHGVWGGGIYCYEASPTIKNNVVSGNRGVSKGGGIYCYQCSPIITDNIVEDNFADDYGGGICCWDSSSPTIARNVIAGNTTPGHGGGIHLDVECDPLVTNNTIANNQAGLSGGGISAYYNCRFEIANAILWANEAPTHKEIDNSGGSTVTVSYSDIDGGWPGTGNLDADPLFVDPVGGDHHMKHDSPCKNTGDNSASARPSKDFEADPRIAESRVDIGADEFHPHLYSIGKVMPGETIEIKIVGESHASPITLGEGTGIQEPPQSTPYGDLYLDWPIERFSLGPIPQDGILVRRAPVPPDAQPGEQVPLQALIGAEAPGAELTNLMVLTVELEQSDAPLRQWAP